MTDESEELRDLLNKAHFAREAKVGEARLALAKAMVKAEQAYLAVLETKRDE